MERNMPAAYVVDLYSKLENMGIPIWLDGGWAVDALLGEETRDHVDLDIAIQEKDLKTFCDYLESEGYREVPKDEDMKWTIVLGDTKGHEIDVHAFNFDKDGNIVEKDEYPDGSLSGIGTILGQTLRCVDAEHLVQFHLRHEPRDKDFKDVTALCEKFNIPTPPRFLSKMKSR